jgi:Protein containing von Willebrand factor type A (vWA) domain
LTWPDAISTGSPPVDEAPIVAVLVDFASHLRRAGIAVGSGEVLTYCQAMATLDPTNLVDLYWAGRSIVVTRREQIPIYDRVFRAYFLGGADERATPARTLVRAMATTASVLQIPAVDPGPANPEEHQAQMGLMASTVDILRDKSFAACTPEELAALRRIMATMRLAPPRRRTRRLRPANRGRTPDPRRTVREMMRRHGELTALRWRTRRHRPRRLVLILDVSGSMADYSRALLQFAHSATRATDRVEAFCFGTRLTRVTPALRWRSVDEALARAATAVTDWEGGTRIGDCLTTFVRDWGRRGIGRGAIVVICSDGLDRGDPDVLATAVERLSRLCHRIVWVNPHAQPTGRSRVRGGYRATTLAMMVVEPYVDLLVAGQDLRGLEELAVRLAELA